MHHAVATGEWRRLDIAQLHDRCSLSNIVRVTKLRSGNMAHMGDRRGAYRVLVGRAEGKRPLGRPRSKWELHIVMNLQEVKWKGLD
jgi:hypothetical protein